MLNDRQARFVAEYLIDGNGTQAAIRAGYSANTAESQASRLLRNAKVAEALAERRGVVMGKLEITQERIAQELALIGFCNMQDYIRIVDGEPVVDLSSLTRDQAAAIGEVTVEDFKDGRGEDSRDVRRVKFKLLDKRAALVDLGRWQGMFKDKVEVTVTDLADVIAKRRKRVADRAS